jgi:hypothetical protein
VDERASIIDAARSSFVDLVTRGVGKDWQDWALREVRKVTEEDVKRILNEVVAGVFVPEKTDVVITCGGIMTDVSLSYFLLLVRVMLTGIRISRRISKEQASTRKSSNSPTSKTRTDSKATRRTAKTKRFQVATMTTTTMTKVTVAMR